MTNARITIRLQVGGGAALFGDPAIAAIRLVLYAVDTHQDQASRQAARLPGFVSGQSALRARLEVMGRWNSTLWR